MFVTIINGIYKEVWGALSLLTVAIQLSFEYEDLVAKSNLATRTDSSLAFSCAYLFFSPSASLLLGLKASTPMRPASCSYTNC